MTSFGGWGEEKEKKSVPFPPLNKHVSKSAYFYEEKENKSLNLFLVLAFFSSKI